jgi:hypothetical protein
MLADAAIFHKTPMQVALFGVVELAVVLTLAYLAKRAHPDRLRFTRVAWLTAACLATSLPFAFVAYRLWPWDLDSKNLRFAVVLALLGTFFAPFVTAFVLVRRVGRTERHRAHETQTDTRP